jgi:hypothetical protein
MTNTRAARWISDFHTPRELGLYGDFLFSANSKHGGSMLSSIQGPVFGLAEEGLNLTQGNLIQLAQGQDTHVYAEAIKFIRGITPGTSLWYAKGAFDHMIFHQMQEYFSPGYLSTMQARARREFGQSYWWQPGGDLSDAREPDWTKALGE